MDIGNSQHRALARPAELIRPYAPEDIQQVIKLLETLRRRTPYRAIVPDWPEIVRVITACSNKRSGLVLVADHDGRITGLLIAVAQVLWWQNERAGARIASDLIFYSQRPGDGAKMLKGMIEWAFSVPRVVRIECGISSGEDVEALQKLYLDAGFKKDGTRFVMDHPKYAEALMSLA